MQSHERDVDVSFILPCLNEERGLAMVVETLDSEAAAAGLSFEIIVCDNGSTDRSREIVAQLAQNNHRIRSAFEPRRGYGAAIMHSIQQSHGRCIVTLDADNTYTVADTLECAKLALQHKAFIIGNRLGTDDARAHMPAAHRIAGTPLFALLLRTLFGIHMIDPNCGLRAFPRKDFIAWGCTTTGMEFASETIIRASCSGTPFIEFPIAYKARVGASKLRTLRDGLRHLRTIFELRVRMIGTRR